MKKTFKDIRLGDKVYELINGKFNEVTVDIIGELAEVGKSITTSSLNDWTVEFDESFHYNSIDCVLFCEREDALKDIQSQMYELDKSYNERKEKLVQIQHDILGEPKNISNVQVGDKVWVIADTMIETATITDINGCELTVKNDYNKLLKGGIIFDFGGVKENATYLYRFTLTNTSAMYCFLNLQGAIDHLKEKVKTLREQANLLENKAKTLK